MKTNLGGETMADGRTVATTIKGLICEHMPTAAVASGWLSPVDVSGLVAEMEAGHGWRAVLAWTEANGADQTGSLGLSWVRRYCEAHGLPTSDTVVKPYRQALLLTAMREEAAKAAG